MAVVCLPRAACQSSGQRLRFSLGILQNFPAKVMCIYFFMRRSNRNFNISPPLPPPPGKARAFELLKIGSFQIPAPSGQNSVQIPYPIVEFVCQMPLLKNNRCPFLSSVIKLVHIPCMRRHKFKMKRYFGLLLHGTR